MKDEAEKTRQNNYGNHTLTLDDFPDLQSAIFDDPQNSWSTLASKRKPILKLLDDAGLTVDKNVLAALPRWSDVVDLYGEKPVIHGLETCAPFRQQVPVTKRFVGVAGQMNVGTNALAKLFRSNLEITENEMYRGVLWTVPWYKHGWVSLRNKYKYRLPDEHENVMPVVVIRDPYFWMRRYVKSANCKSPC